MPTPIQRLFSILLDTNVQLEFLLPNGLILSLELDSDITLLDAKDELWSAAAKQPLFELLLPKDCYVFAGINKQTAEEEEYYDQSLRVRELPLLLPYLRVVETTRDSNLLEKNKQDSTIASCIGISSSDMDHAELRIPEVKWARNRLSQLAMMHRTALQETGLDGIAQYLTASPRDELSTWFKSLVNNLHSITISAWVLDGDEPAKERCVRVELDCRSTVLNAITRILEAQLEMIRTTRGLNISLIPGNASSYVLKVCCSQSYLFDLDAQLISYTYVQQCLEKNQYPCLSPIIRKDVCDALMELLTDTPGACMRPPSSTRQNVFPTSADDFGDSGKLSHALLPKCGGVPCSNPVHIDKDSPYQELEKFARTAGETDMNESKLTRKSSVTCLWNLPGYLCVQVRSAKFLPGAATRQSSGSAPGSPTNASPLVAAFTASFDVIQSVYIVRVGLFHGSQSLIELQATGEMPGNHLNWNKSLNFHVRLADIPPAARLCVALIKVQRTSDKRSGKTSEYPIGWANVNLFDHQGFMIQGDLSLPLWPASILQSSVTHFHQLYPAGTVLSNPDPEFTLQIRIVNPVKKRVLLPSFHSFIEAYSNLTTTASAQRPLPLPSALPHQGIGDDEEDASNFLDSDTPEMLHLVFGLHDNRSDVNNFLRELVSRDPLYELSEQEKTALWQARYLCLKDFPEALPWLTQSVCWYRRQSLMEFYYLLHLWPRPLPVPIALRLLGAMGLTTGSSSGSVALAQLGSGSAMATRASGGASGVADASVRELAVSSLYSLSDAELCDYLLQLVQALKAEPYLDNPLSRFILFRALRNPIVIGLRFFWHLRSEIHLPDVRLKFGILLEAFCVGSGPLLAFLAPQVTALNRLETISARVKELTNEEEQRALFRQEVCRHEARRDLQWLLSPMCLSERLGRLVVDKCDVKRSKKRPLWLVWTNPDQLGQHHHRHYQLIFKHGDDLRQDMLTLQLLRVMDRIWKSEGLDMCLTTYGCLATGPEMGMIEVVRNSRTVMSIQGERLRAALQIDSTQLYKWLTTQRELGPPLSTDSVEYERIIRNFTVSCAAYCVATFVLGIRDRHPDNIMVDTSGRLFHIDFGHILDNRKKKFGISRERVPFVLTKDFITVIARGNADVVLGSPLTETGAGGSRDIYLQEFTQLCRRAYMSLRKHANLLLTLFAMMLPCGLPELTSLCDLEYVRRALAVDMDETKAMAYFNEKFNEAYYGAWTTKIDWFGHWMNT